LAHSVANGRQCEIAAAGFACFYRRHTIGLINGKKKKKEHDIIIESNVSMEWNDRFACRMFTTNQSEITFIYFCVFLFDKFYFQFDAVDHACCLTFFLLK
jgi:hypothetical protein